jgi:predicted nucleic acid-binding protein
MTVRIVADASVIVKWFVPESYSEQAQALLEDHLAGRAEILAPSYAILEVANALRKYVLRGIMSIGDAREAISILSEIDLHLYDVDTGEAMEALEYASRTGVTVYDAYYIILARRNNAVFYTADEKLLRRLAGVEPLARHVKDYGKA